MLQSFLASFLVKADSLIRKSCTFVLLFLYAANDVAFTVVAGRLTNNMTFLIVLTGGSSIFVPAGVCDQSFQPQTRASRLDAWAHTCDNQCSKKRLHVISVGGVLINTQVHDGRSVVCIRCMAGPHAHLLSNPAIQRDSCS